MEDRSLGLNSGSPAYQLHDLGQVTSLCKLHFDNLQNVDTIFLLRSYEN